jgi:hypothetical protein
MKIVFITLICCASLIGDLQAQHAHLSRQDKKRIRIMYRFCTYVKKTPPEQMDQALLFKKYLAFEHILQDTAQNQIQQKVFNKLMKDLHTVLDTTHLSSYRVVPWHKYRYKERLPRMIWEDEPLTHIWGNPLPVKKNSHQQAVLEGERQLDYIMVCYKKEKPQEPVYYFLFDERNTIVSWLLVRQGGSHYFLTF